MVLGAPAGSGLRWEPSLLPPWGDDCTTQAWGGQLTPARSRTGCGPESLYLGRALEGAYWIGGGNGGGEEGVRGWEKWVPVWLLICLLRALGQVPALSGPQSLSP